MKKAPEHFFAFNNNFLLL